MDWIRYQVLAKRFTKYFINLGEFQRDNLKGFKGKVVDKKEDFLRIYGFISLCLFSFILYVKLFQKEKQYANFIGFF